MRHTDHSIMYYNVFRMYKRGRCKRFRRKQLRADGGVKGGLRVRDEEFHFKLLFFPLGGRHSDFHHIISFL